MALKKKRRDKEGMYSGIGEEARVFASLQLTADYGSQSGLVPVG